MVDLMAMNVLFLCNFAGVCENDIMKQSNTPEEYSAPEKPSKSEIKRRLEARQYLAEEISQMPDKWKQMPIPERLLDALKETPNVRSHGGIRRHIQYLGKIMGTMSEEEVDGIKQALIAIVGAKKASKMKI
jgi:ribosome-associated protein